MCLNRTSEWNVMTIWISRELPLFNFNRLDILCDWIRHPIETLWPFELLKSFHWSISSISIYYGTKSDIRVKTYCGLNLLRASVFNFECLDILRDSIGNLSKKLLWFNLRLIKVILVASVQTYLPSISCSPLSLSLHLSFPPLKNPLDRKSVV